LSNCKFNVKYTRLYNAILICYCTLGLKNAPTLKFALFSMSGLKDETLIKANLYEN